MTESLHALSGAYVVDALDDHEREVFEQHLPGCLDCQAEVASLREATAVLADAIAVDPPASLRASVLSGITTIRPLPPEVAEREVPADDAPVRLAPVVPLRQRRTFRLGTLAAAAAIVVAGGVGIAAQPWNDDRPAPSAEVSPADRVLTAADAQKEDSATFTDGSTATVYRSESQGKAVLLTTRMAAPPTGKTFELWLRDAVGRLHPAGLMSTPGENKLLLKGDAGKANAVGITVEPEGGSQQPTSEPIAMLEFEGGDA